MSVKFIVYVFACSAAEVAEILDRAKDAVYYHDEYGGVVVLPNRDSAQVRVLAATYPYLDAHCFVGNTLTKTFEFDHGLAKVA